MKGAFGGASNDRGGDGFCWPLDSGGPAENGNGREGVRDICDKTGKTGAAEVEALKGNSSELPSLLLCRLDDASLYSPELSLSDTPSSSPVLNGSDSLSVCASVGLFPSAVPRHRGFPVLCGFELALIVLVASPGLKPRLSLLRSRKKAAFCPAAIELLLLPC
jgi:hypothetical protein